MSAFYRNVNLTAKATGILVAAGASVIKADGAKHYPFKAGDLLVYDPTTKLTLDAAGIATASKLRFAQGHNPNGGLMATELRHLGHTNIDLCRTSLMVNVQKPQLSLPMIIDLEFDCSKTGEDRMVQIDIDDWLTRSYFKEGQVGSLIYNLRTDIQGCDSCSEEENCQKIACQLAAKIRNDFIKGYGGTSKLGLNLDRPNHGVWGAQKFDSERTIPLAVSPVTSEGCTAVIGLKTLAVTGLADLDLSGYVDPANPTQTLAEQLNDVIDAINYWLSGKGTAYLARTDSETCDYVIKINSCLDDTTWLLTHHDDTTEAGTSADAFEAFDPDPECSNCDAQAEVTLTCGVRLFINPLALPCYCSYPDGNQPSYYGRTATVHAWGPGWDNRTFRVVKVQDQVVPTGTGYQVQQQEFSQSHGGTGRDYPYGEMYSDDRIPLPLAKSAAAQASIANCEDQYCIWSVVTRDQMASSLSRHVSNSQTLNFINVPRGNETLIGSVQDILVALDSRGFCSTINHECVSIE